MKNFVQCGDRITTVAPYAVSAGGGALVGSMFGVALNDAANGAEVVLMTEGVFNLAKVSTEAWTRGAKIYWDNTAKLVTSVSTSNTLIGVAADVTVNPSATGPVRLGIVA